MQEALKRHDYKEFAASPMKDNFEPEEELDRTREEIQQAQKLAGELLWLAGKTRPDLAYTTSRNIRKTGESILEVAADASFAPGGGLSHGSVVASM